MEKTRELREMIKLIYHLLLKMDKKQLEIMLSVAKHI